jgi:hypothetical protein
MAFDLSSFTDPRILVQTVLDFFDHFPHQIIKASTIKKIQEIRDQTKNKNLYVIFSNPELSETMEKYEFYILQFFVKFIVAILDQDKSLKDQLKDILFRIAVSLTGQRKILDNNFFNRSIINFKSKDIMIPSLTDLMYTWVCESFEEDYEEIETAFKGLSSPVLMKKKTQRKDRDSLFKLKPAD